MARTTTTSTPTGCLSPLLRLFSRSKDAQQQQQQQQHTIDEAPSEKHDERAPRSASRQSSREFHRQARLIAQLPVAGGGTPRRATRTDAAAATAAFSSDGTTVCGGDGSEKNSDKGTWRGRPNGTAYDRRTELTAEDEDMWARLAM